MHMKLRTSLLNSLSFLFTGIVSSSRLNSLHTFVKRCFPAQMMGARIDPLVSYNWGMILLRFCLVQCSSSIVISAKFGPSSLPLFLIANESLMLGDRSSVVRFQELPKTCSSFLCNFSMISGLLMLGSITDFIPSLYLPQAFIISCTVFFFFFFCFPTRCQVIYISQNGDYISGKGGHFFLTH